eukprot:5973050-Prymnesium_polylepis.1
MRKLCQACAPRAGDEREPQTVAQVITEELHAAATTVQKFVREHAARDDDEERRRNAWLRQHFDRGEWDEALKYAVADEERQIIEDARAEAATVNIQK